MPSTLALKFETPSQTARMFKTIEVVPADARIGADIVGVDFVKLSDVQLAEVRQAWLDHSVVRFRGTKVSDEDQMAFTGRLGEFVKHPRQLKGEEGAHPKYEEILVIANGDEAGMPAGTMGNSECRWHSDTYIVDRPPAAAILKAVRLPSGGGNTYFSDMYGLYEDLPAGLKRDLAGRMIQLDVVRDGGGRIRKGRTLPETDDYRLWPAIRHPIVRTHGETGRNALYLGAEAETAWIVGLPFDESRGILDMLWEKVADPEYIWTQVWKPNDIIMWDNRCLKHRRDGWNGTEIRTMHRTTTMGERPAFVL